MNWDTLSRFDKPLAYFFPSIKEKFDDLKHNQAVEGAFKRAFGTAEGETVLRHLISEYGLDAQIGNIQNEDVLYVSAQQDVVKYILSLVN